MSLPGTLVKSCARRSPRLPSCSPSPSAASAATRHLSPSGSDAGNCLSTPCATFARAYNQAAPAT